jgi:DNA polymerase
MTSLYVDAETYSATPIRAGGYRYAQASELLLLAWAIDDSPVRVWDATFEPVPTPLAQALATPAIELVAHNAMFDRIVLRAAGFDTDVSRWYCTMTQAMAHSLPGKLDTLCKMFGLDEDAAKLDGRDYIALFCKPRPKNSKVRRYTRETHPTEWAGFVKYAGRDITSMRHLRGKMPTWNFGGTTEVGRRELALWHLDQAINDHGVYVDQEFSTAAVESMTALLAGMAERTQELTNDEVSSTTKRDKLLAHLLAQYGVSLPDMQAGTLERRLDDPDLPEPVKELLRIRLEASLTAGKKHKVVLGSVCSDGRMHGLLRFCGAGRTARWSGQILQPQNFVRPPKYLKGDKYDDAVQAIKDGRVASYEKPMEVISGTIRGVLIPAPGRRFAVADLSNIEGRMLAWLAGEDWKTAAYARGDDLYVRTYARTFGISEEEVWADVAAGGKMRDIGKVEELALGYQGAVGAFSVMAAAYGVELEEAEVVRLVKGWRKANSQISSFWYELGDMAKTAIRNPGQVFECRRLRLIRKGAWLRIILPSGRALCYPRPRIGEDGKIAFDGQNQYTRKWGTIKTYGGKLVENVTQASARDIMAHSMPAIQAAGFDIELTVHDEIITEVDEDSPLNGEILAALMSEGPAWAEGLPLAAVGKDLTRYRKA